MTSVSNKPIFVGLLILAILIPLTSIFTYDAKKDVRILGVHEVIPTVKPTSIIYPTIKPTIFVCKEDGAAVINPDQCCSGKAYILWSSYICGTSSEFLKPTIKPTAKPTIKPTINPTIKPTVSCGIGGCNVTVVPTKAQLLTCEEGILEAKCVDSNSESCQQWHRGTDCKWTCVKKCVATKRCEAKNLGTNCVNKSGQTCQEYRNSDCSIDCTQNCVDKPMSVQSNSKVVNSLNFIVSSFNNESCGVGVDYNKDGVINSMDVSFCNNKKSGVEKTYNAVVNAVNKNVSMWVEWITLKMIGE